MASHTTVRIDPAAHRTLQALRRQTGATTPEILGRALEEYRRRHFLEGLAEDFAALRMDTTISANERAESALWDATATDGLDGGHDGRPAKPRSATHRRRSAR